jgi:hypothetical protein
MVYMYRCTKYRRQKVWLASGTGVRIRYGLSRAGSHSGIAEQIPKAHNPVEMTAKERKDGSFCKAIHSRYFAYIYPFPVGCRSSFCHDGKCPDSEAQHLFACHCASNSSSQLRFSFLLFSA